MISNVFDYYDSNSPCAFNSYLVIYLLSALHTFGGGPQKSPLRNWRSKNKLPGQNSLRWYKRKENIQSTSHTLCPITHSEIHCLCCCPLFSNSLDQTITLTKICFFFFFSQWKWTVFIVMAELVLCGCKSSLYIFWQRTGSTFTAFVLACYKPRHS